jgi:hypothetical protein
MVRGRNLKVLKCLQNITFSQEDGIVTIIDMRIPLSIVLRWENDWSSQENSWLTYKMWSPSLSGALEQVWLTGSRN